MSSFSYYHKISKCNTIQDSAEYLKLFCSTLFSLITLQGKSISSSQSLAYGKLFLQQVYLKSESVIKILEGIDNKNLNHIVDYSSIFSVVRSVFEYLYKFELIYRTANNEEQREILFELFKFKGLKERQKYRTITIGNTIKKEFENNELIECIQRIKSSNIYKNLDKQQKAFLDNKMNNGRTFNFYFDKDNNIIDYESLSDLLSIKEHAIDDLYSFMSLHSHPSYIALIQLDSSYKNDAWKSMTCTAIMQLVLLLSVFVSEYCFIYPDADSFYYSLTDEHRFALGLYNYSIRNLNESPFKTDMHNLINRYASEVDLL